MGKKSKEERKRQFQLSEEKEKALSDVLRYSNKRFKKFDEVITQLYAGQDLSRFFNTDKRMWKINECFNSISKNGNQYAAKSLKDVFIYLDECSSIMSDENLIQAVYNAFQFRANWRKNIFKWKPVNKYASLQFDELAGYLFCKYEVPGFLYKAFYETNDKRFVQWFIHLAAGGKVKEMDDIPIPFIQKMGHYFIQASADLSITAALRWAQVKGLGGTDELAKRIAYSWIGTKPFADENFWESFIQLLVRSGMFNYEKLTELIDYVRETKRQNPGYNLKGRTLQSLTRQSDAWHGVYKHVKGNWFWKPSGLYSLKIDRKTDIVKVEELTEATRLVEEGTAMKHCVASYAHLCAQGRSAIFSLRKYADGKLEDILATIEVNIFLKAIVQAKAKMNRPISQEAKKYMEMWAAKNALTINPYL
ncbi:MAG TPA: PcfJ domain-containing protein [Chitinophagaceae bacterium]|nr:PcfJ domain-containing protein [Chitinophagaceae bacterium]